MRQTALPFVIVIVGHMHELAGLLDHGFGDGWMSVPQAGYGDARPQIQITLPGGVIDITARAVAQDDVEPSVTGDNILLEQRLHRRRVVPHNWRWRWNNVFHESVTRQSVASGVWLFKLLWVARVSVRVWVRPFENDFDVDWRGRAQFWRFGAGSRRGGGGTRTGGMAVADGGTKRQAKARKSAQSHAAPGGCCASKPEA